MVMDERMSTRHWWNGSDKGNYVHREKHAPLLCCSTRTPHGLPQDHTKAPVVTGWQLTTHAMEWQEHKFKTSKAWYAWMASRSVSFFVHNFSLPLFAPIFTYTLFSSTCTIFIQTGYRNNSVIYPCTHCTYSLHNKSL